MANSSTDFFQVFEVFAKHKVKYILVGGVSAVLHGAPVTTFDLDLVHNRAEENIENLFQALQELHAFYRTRRDIRIEPVKNALAGPGHHLFLTDAGPLDLLGVIGDNLDYQGLLQDTEILQVGDLEIRVQNLESLIRVKQFIGREKDKAILPILIKTLEEKKKNK